MDPYVDKALVIGGFLGQAEEWEKASDAWEKCLHESPAIEYSAIKKRKVCPVNSGDFLGKAGTQKSCPSLT
jgi:hypothetical protein